MKELYEPRVFCECGWNKYAPHCSAFHASCGCPVCPMCGNKVEDMKVIISTSTEIKIGNWWSGYSITTIFRNKIGDVICENKKT